MDSPFVDFAFLDEIDTTFSTSSPSQPRSVVATAVNTTTTKTIHLPSNGSNSGIKITSLQYFIQLFELYTPHEVVKSDQQKWIQTQLYYMLNNDIIQEDRTLQFYTCLLRIPEFHRYIDYDTFYSLRDENGYNILGIATLINDYNVVVTVLKRCNDREFVNHLTTEKFHCVDAVFFNKNFKILELLIHNNIDFTKSYVITNRTYDHIIFKDPGYKNQVATLLRRYDICCFTTK